MDHEVLEVCGFLALAAVPSKRAAATFAGFLTLKAEHVHGSSLLVCARHLRHDKCHCTAETASDSSSHRSSASVINTGRSDELVTILARSARRNFELHALEENPTAFGQARGRLAGLA